MDTPEFASHKNWNMKKDYLSVKFLIQNVKRVIALKVFLKNHLNIPGFG